ncbi:MAG: nucleotidyltransferase [Verrucomicrobia bacterium]|nr:nucleotidyltransferase [Verrucomicrobiota bacterium]
MNELAQLALGLQTFWQGKGWKGCVIGGLAVQAWGEPRFTMDVDLNLLVGLGREEEFIDAWLEKFSARIPNVKEFALENRVLLLRSLEGIGIDIALGCLPYEDEAIGRAVDVEFDQGVKIKICTPEDLLIMKSFADRPQDWIDIRGILIRQNPRSLDWSYIRRHLKVLLDAKESPELMTKLEKLRDELSTGRIW